LLPALMQLLLLLLLLLLPSLHTVIAAHSIAS
jgi:hypothetical protein